MSTQLRTYTFDNVAAVINGALLTGFWEGDDAVSVEPGSPVTNNMVGASGDVLSSITTNKSAIITIRLQHAGDGHAMLSAMLAQYQAGAPFIFSCGVTDVGTGDGGSAPECVIQDAPTKGLGANASMREWKIFAGCWTDTPTNYIGA